MVRGGKMVEDADLSFSRRGDCQRRLLDNSMYRDPYAIVSTCVPVDTVNPLYFAVSGIPL